MSVRIQAYILFIVSAAIWGTSVPVIKATINYIPPLTFLMIRFWIAGIITIPLAIHLLTKYKINKERFTKIFIASFLGHILTLALLFVGINLSTSIQTSLIFALTPLLISLMGLFFLHEIITKKEIKGTLIAFIGTLIIILAPVISTLSKKDIFQGNITGNFLIFLAVISNASYIIYAKKHLTTDKIISPTIQITASFVLAAIVFTFLGFSEQALLINKERSTRIRTCNTYDIDRFKNHGGLECDNQGCFNTRATNNNTYTCIIRQENKSVFTEIFTKLGGYITPPAIYGILYMAWIPGIIGYILYQRGLKFIEASEATLFTYLEPLFGIPIAVIFLKEGLTTIFIVGAILITFGIYIAEKKSTVS